MDTSLFYIINHGLSNPLLDGFMPFYTDRWFLFAVPFLAWFFAKDWRRALDSLILAAIAVGLADLMGNQLKHLIGRVRPCSALADVNLLTGCGGSFSMPSNHTANAFAAMATLAFIWRCRIQAGLWLVAALVGFSRVYVGVHYPSDVLAGGLLGGFIGYWCSKALPVLEGWHRKYPGRTELALSLLIITALRIVFIVKGPYDLAGDEAHYWEWSRRLDWSYYSKGPMIAWLIRLFTLAGGSSELAVRSGAALSSALTSVALYMLTMQMYRSRRAALMAGLIPQATPLFTTYGIIMTIDPPFVLLWSVALLLFYRAVFMLHKAAWYWLGLVIGLGLLTKYTMVFFFPAALAFIAVSKSDRFWLGRKEPWLAALISMVVFSPVIFWNQAHNWVSFRHTAGHVVQSGGFIISFKTLGDFLGSQLAVISPVLLVIMLVAAMKPLDQRRDRREWMLFSFSVPILVFFLVKSLQGKVQGNWAMEAYPALFVLLAAHFDRYWMNIRTARITVIAGLALSIAMAGVIHSPGLVHRFVDRFAIMDKLIGWQELAQRVDELVDEMPQRERTFVFSDNYMVSSELAFYMKDRPVTYNAPVGRRMNQYQLWPGYHDLKGFDAVFVIMSDGPIPAILAERFDRIERLPYQVRRYGQSIQTFTLFQCFGFKGMKPEEVTSY